MKVETTSPSRVSLTETDIYTGSRAASVCTVRPKDLLGAQSSPPSSGRRSESNRLAIRMRVAPSVGRCQSGCERVGAITM